MASRLLRKTLTTSTRYLTSPAPVRVSPPAVQKTAIPLPHSVAAAASFRGPSATTVFKRMYSVHQPDLQHEEIETENEDQWIEKKLMKVQFEEKMEKENEEQSDEVKILKFKDEFNTSQKILIACLADFSFALDFAKELKDARNIVVVSPYSCGEMKRLFEDSRSHMLELNSLGATIHFNVDIMEFGKDNEGNRTLYDHTLLVIKKGKPYEVVGLCSIHQPEPQLEEKVEVESKEDAKKENENEEQSEKNVEIADDYNTSQKILFACVRDFAYAHHIAKKLGDARNIVVISPNSRDEMERLHEHARTQILELTELGATIHFNVNIRDYKNDSRVNQTLYDLAVLVI